MGKLMIVEDDKELNSSVCAYFEANGYSVKACYNGAEAFSPASNTSFANGLTGGVVSLTILIQLVILSIKFYLHE